MTTVYPPEEVDCPDVPTGIIQSDLLIRHAIMEGIRRLRANPWLLDYVWAWQKYDPLTKDKYGQKEIDQARKWFLSTDIPVFLFGFQETTQCPCVTIQLSNTEPEYVTLADSHSTPWAEVDRPDNQWPALTPLLNPVYDLSTGKVTLPDDPGIIIVPGQKIVLNNATAYEILSVDSNTVFYIEEGLVLDLSNSVIKSSSAKVMLPMESMFYKEVYILGCHTNTEPAHLLYLYSIIAFILLWGKQDLLEARGFAKSFFTSTDFSKNEPFQVENMWARYITLSGSVQHIWPKQFVGKIDGIEVSALKVIGGENVPPPEIPAELMWVGDKDSIG